MDFSAPHQRIGALCTLSLLLEVSATPKPGLVDRLGSGAHTDMDFSTFLASAAAIAPYLTACAQAGLVFIGPAWAQAPAKSAFSDRKP